MKSSTFRLLSPAEVAELDEREAEWWREHGIPDPHPATGKPDEPHLLIVSAVTGDAAFEEDYEDAVTVRHGDGCGHDGYGGHCCLLWVLQDQDGLPFLHADHPSPDHTIPRLAPGAYWVQAWTSQDYWGEWDGGIALLYPEEAQDG